MLCGTKDHSILIPTVLVGHGRTLKTCRIASTMPARTMGINSFKAAWMELKKGLMSPNHTQTPNDLFDYYMSKLNGSELKVMLAIVRLTLGWHRRKAKASLRNIQKITGISHRRLITKAAEKLQNEHGLIEYDPRNSEWKICWLENNPPYMGVLGGEKSSPLEESGGEKSSPGGVKKFTGSGEKSSPLLNKKERLTKKEDLSTKDIWLNTQKKMADIITRGEFDTWIRDCRLIRTNGNSQFTIGVSNEYACNIISEKYGNHLQSIISDEVGYPAIIKIEVHQD